MAECIIARGGGYGGGGSNGGLPPVIVGFCQIVATVLDSDGVPVPDMYVTCKDGSTWYNYHTNENGQCLFITNSGSANITAYNFSNENSYRYMDQESTDTMNIDAPVTTSKYANFQFNRISNIRYYKSGGNIWEKSNYYFYARDSRFRVTNQIGEVIVVGGGGGGGTGQTIYDNERGNYGKNTNMSFGGGGGAANHAFNIKVLKNTNYGNFHLGTGGEGGWQDTYTYGRGSSGGTTSALGVSALGGSGGTYYGGSGEGEVGNAGGGGNGAWVNGLSNFSYPTDGSNGFGGGGGAWHYYYDDPYSNSIIVNRNFWYGYGGSGGYVDTTGAASGSRNNNYTIFGADDGRDGYGEGGGGGFAGNPDNWSQFPNFRYNNNGFYCGNGGNGLIQFINMT